MVRDTATVQFPSLHVTICVLQVGWQLGRVIDLLQDKESGTEVYLTVKKRPRHSNLIDQVYFKPFRLPNKKRTPYRWNSSPRPDLLASLPKITLPPKL